MKASPENPRRRAVLTVAAVVLLAAGDRRILRGNRRRTRHPDRPDREPGRRSEHHSGRQPRAIGRRAAGNRREFAHPGSNRAEPDQGDRHCRGRHDGQCFDADHLRRRNCRRQVGGSVPEYGHSSDTDQSFEYASSFAGKAARILTTLAVAPAGGQPVTSTYVVPITLE